MNVIESNLLKYDLQVPRYTSYPTAVHFSPKVNAEKYSSWLKALDEGTSLSIYIHIPFDPKLCWYCGCNTKVTHRYEPVRKYLNLLQQEIKIISNILGSKRTVKQIHFGGGSPTILSAADFIKFNTF